MTKVRKQKRRKKFRYGVNRKKLKRKHTKLPSIDCDTVKAEWTKGKSVVKNLKEMGLVYDPNETFKIPSTKQTLKQGIDDVEKMEVVEPEASKKFVAEKLQAEAKMRRERQFRLPKGEVQYVTYLMDTYGEDYKAMTRDKKNYYQETWKQIRAKINRFKSIPEQYEEYLKSKNNVNE